MGRSPTIRADKEPFLVKGTLDEMGTEMKKGSTEDNKELTVAQQLDLCWAISSLY